MELITLIPAVLCIVAIFRGGTPMALRYVVLPTLLLLPTYFYWIAKPLPSINFIDAALVPLGAGIILTNLRRWRFTLTDAWLLVFLFSSAYADYALGKTTNAAFALFASLTTGLIPYMAGKMLIEQTGNRINMARTFVLLLSVSTFFSAYEYLLKKNPYTWLWSHFYPGQWSIWYTQVRWGFGRMAGPFSQSELAGMVIFAAWLLAIWLGRNAYPAQPSDKPLPSLIKNGKAHVRILFVALLLTQARGPWIGAVVAVAVASIGSAVKPLRRALMVVGCLVLIGIPIYLFAGTYLSGPRKDYGSEKETAQYRKELISNYIPVAVKGEALGWGTSFPRIDGQDSIDNEYLYVWLTQGYVGAIAFILLISTAVVVLVFRAARSRTLRDRHFVLTLLAIILGMAFTLSTVFLGDQTYILLFFLIGWSQAIGDPKEKRKLVHNVDVYEMGSRPKLMRVYS